MKVIEFNRDYYLEKDRVIFTAEFHKNRKSCCGNQCRHCPYTKPHKRGNTKLQEDADRDTNRTKDGGSET